LISALALYFSAPPPPKSLDIRAGIRAEKSVPFSVAWVEIEQG